MGMPRYGSRQPISQSGKERERVVREGDRKRPAPEGAKSDSKQPAGK